MTKRGDENGLLFPEREDESPFLFGRLRQMPSKPVQSGESTPNVGGSLSLYSATTSEFEEESPFLLTRFIVPAHESEAPGDLRERVEFAEEEQEELFDPGWLGEHEPPSLELDEERELEDGLEHQADNPFDTFTSSEQKAIRLTSALETGKPGGFFGLTGNFDDYGISFGLMNWNIGAGSLQPLLEKFMKRFPKKYAAIFDSDAKRFQEVIQAKIKTGKYDWEYDIKKQMEFVLEHVADAKAVREPWTGYFRKLSKDADFQDIQIATVRDRMRDAVYWCDYFSMTSERALVFMFDLVASHGAGWLKKPGRKRRPLLRAAFQRQKDALGRDLTDVEKMVEIAEVIGKTSGKRWRAKARKRKRWIALGVGQMRKKWELSDFNVTDDAFTTSVTNRKPIGGGAAASKPVTSPELYEPGESFAAEELEALEELEDAEGEEENAEGELYDPPWLGESPENEADRVPLNLEEPSDSRTDAELLDLDETSELCEDGELDEVIEAPAQEAEPEFEYENGPIATLDPDAAVPAFSSKVKSRVCLPLLDAKQIQRAVEWNHERHPKKSGVDLSAIDAQLANYVDGSAVQAAIRQYNQQHTSDPIPDGQDAMRVHCVHQFQCKCFADGSQRAGLVGESTLDALGFVMRPKRVFDTIDKVNSTAAKRLAAVEKSLSGLTSRTWFDHMVNPPFLGYTFKNGIHLILLRKLRTAEKYLMALPVYRDRTPVELGRDLDVEEQHKGARPTATTSSMHTFGLATDIGYTGNPWVAGNPDAPRGNRSFNNVTQRASLLFTGNNEPFTAQALDALGTDNALTTAEVYESVKEQSNRLRAYLYLAFDEPALKQLLADRKAVSTPGVFTKGESDAKALARWKKQIASDLDVLRTVFHSERNPLRGFLVLHRDLVMALRDRGCLAWGAVDLGPNQSGDMMHVDARADGVGRAVRPLKAHEVTKGHPCVGGIVSAAGAIGPQPPPLVRRVRDASGETLFVEIVLGGEREARPVTAIFIPDGYRTTQDVDVVLYLPGHKVRDHKRDYAIDDYLTRTKSGSSLRSEVHASGRNLIFVAPTLGPKSQVRAGSHGFGPGQVDLYIYRVLCALRHFGPYSGGSVRLGHLTVSGHSGGGRPMLDLLQTNHDVNTRLREVWCFDSMYQSARDWEKWARARPDVKVHVYYEDTDTNSRSLEKAKLPNVSVMKSSDHDRIPPKHLRERLEGSTVLSKR